MDFVEMSEEVFVWEAVVLRDTGVDGAEGAAVKLESVILVWFIVEPVKPKL